MKKFVLKNDSLPGKEADFRLPYGELLNKAQLEAVLFTEGAALVAAGAGTGKTRTLIYRVARLIESGVNPDEILLLTFTRRAATEMLARASDILDSRCHHVRGGTFHYYCNQILRQHAGRLGYPADFTIIDVSDALEIIQFVRAETMKLEKTKITRFPNKNTLYAIISSAVNKETSIEAAVLNGYPQFHECIPAIKKTAAKYREYKAKNFVMDFDDLLVKTRQLLEQHEDIRISVSALNRFVMIDEYQDTNRIQARLTALFSSVHNNIMAVGDDAQSIYSFRGADHKNILEFPRLFSGTKLIKLEENYRSSPQILVAANNLLNQTQHKFDKELYTRNESGELPALVPAPNDHDQSRFITQVILSEREGGASLSDMAVLFRNGRDSFDLELELRRKNIPYVKYGGQKFTEAAHIKDVLAHLRVVVNPMDTIAWNRVLMLIDGIGPKTAAEMYEWIRLAKNPYRLDLSDTASPAYLNQLRALSNLLCSIRKNKNNVSETVAETVQYYKAFCQKRYDDYPKRLKDLEAFINISDSYTSLRRLLEDLVLDPITATAVETEAAQKDEPPLILSTIHSAKGLEWSVVFIIQCLDGIIPSVYSADDEELLDEELRLLYVATTRAEKMLFYCYPVLGKSGYGEYFTRPSRFLEDLQEDTVEEWHLITETVPLQLG